MLHDFSYYSNFIPASICDEMISSFSSLRIQDAKTANEDVSYRQHQAAPLEGQQVIANLVMSVSQSANAANFGFNIYPFPANLAIHKYEAPDDEKDEGDHYHWHTDLAADAYKPPDGNMNYSDRKLSFIANISDPRAYEGGNLEFHGASPEVSETLRARGTAIVFPSFIMHRVTPITKGIRYSIVGWIEGPKFH